MGRLHSYHAFELKFIQPGKPTQNGYVERFNRSFRQGVLDAFIFSDLNQVKGIGRGMDGRLQQS
jgi:transposase InsO family protein